jgi:hypothetical protein
LKDSITRSRTFHSTTQTQLNSTQLNFTRSTTQIFFLRKKKTSSGCQGPWQAMAMDSLKSLEIFQSNIVCPHSYDAKKKDNDQQLQEL